MFDNLIESQNKLADEKNVLSNKEMEFKVNLVTLTTLYITVITSLILNF